MLKIFEHIMGLHEEMLRNYFDKLFVSQFFFRFYGKIDELKTEYCKVFFMLKCCVFIKTIYYDFKGRHYSIIFLVH